MILLLYKYLIFFNPIIASICKLTLFQNDESLTNYVETENVREVPRALIFNFI